MSVESDYHRIRSPVLRDWIHSGNEKGSETYTPVGILACQRDPLLRQLDATVVASVVSSPPAPAKGKNAKKAVLAPTIPQGAVCLEVLLNDTVIFPEGGGQPSDTGIITTQDGTVWNVLQAKRHGGQAIHYVRVHDGNVDSALQKFSPGAQVKVELDQAGFDRRYDHMTLHTSQHLLSALLETRLNLPTLSWSLTSYPSPCYVEIPRGMTVQEISMIQEEANRFVFEGRKIHVEVEELAAENRKPVEKTETGRAIGRGLPEDYTGGVNRVVIIDGVDRNPCCGTHLPSLNNLQIFILPHTDALSRSSTTVARLNFLTGPRLIAHLASSHNHLTSTAAILSCGTPQVPERVQQVVDDRKSGTKRIEDVELELAKYIAADLSQDVQGTDGLFKKHVHRTDDSATALTFLTAISSAFSDALNKSGTEAPYLIVLSSSPSAQLPTNTNVVFILGSDDKRVKEVGDALKSKLGVKGGGKGLKWSGKFVGIWKNGKDDLLVEEILNSVV
ncbi:ThrRS/AlaRS common domain-containing protein [Mycena albidolilacea]|uniref:ThrRS/AlaRS common domain-containing protein n=1 Tax=Mycena albidolilacea TaxID=1033008 RepID=A0AAD7F447_9AGAR|nr:ThrRS/AlaRS common domain-containing protein [Mycena albidolilacea]